MIGTKLAHYEITSHLGSGGMGDVYQATDSKLGRSVAVKILPEAFARDEDRVARFEREARVLASLNHPNIAAIYGLESSNDKKFLVMELVPGETLAERIKRGPIPLDEALRIASQIAEALETAHESGIVHRDLKPANIKQTPDGRVKVLDFGLAKALVVDGNTSNSPTMVTATSGIIMGTAAYMSPEQAKGKDASRASDVWAFGCVLYEMLTGRRAFDGDSTNEILASVLKSEPDWDRLPADTPNGIRRLLRRCLLKKSRLRDFGDARLEIDEVQEEGPLPDGQGPVPGHRGERLAWMSALAFVAVAAVAGIVWVRRPATAPQPPAEIRFEIPTPPTRRPDSLAISPDGRKIVFAGTSDGRSLLWLRSLDSVSSRPLAGTENARLPFWSWDSRSIGFFADGKLVRIDIEGGALRPLTNAIDGHGGAWNRDEVIIFAPVNGTPLMRISAGGGDATVVRKEYASIPANPHFLPDNLHFFHYNLSQEGQPETAGIYIGRLDGPGSPRLVEAQAADYALPDQLLFLRNANLFSQKFDLAAMKLSGDPIRMAEGVAGFSSSIAGPIAYRAGAAGNTQLIWFDRAGRETGRVPGPGLTPSLSPDDRHVAVTRGTTVPAQDVWLLDRTRNPNVFSKFTSGPTTNHSAIWCSGGSRIIFASPRGRKISLYEKPTTGAGTEKLLLETGLNTIPMDCSPDGKFLLYRITDPGTSHDLWAMSLDDRKTFPVVQTKASEREAQFSPDGKWIAYQSNETGQFEIYIQPFPDAKGKRFGPISTNGGVQVRWRRDGKQLELFYLGLDSRLMAVPIRVLSDGQTVDAGTPVALFPTSVAGGIGQNTAVWEYSVSADGRQFLINSEPEVTSPITVILNRKVEP